MSIESFYLRRKIKYNLTSLHNLAKVKNVDDEKVDQHYSSVEIKVIEIAALTRKLRDLGKLPDNTLENKQIKVKRFPSNGANPQRSYISLDKEYKLEEPINDQLNLSRTVDLIIHSYILQVSGDEKSELAGIFVTSDWHRFEGLYYIHLADFIDSCREIVDLYPYSIHSFYDRKQKKWVHKRR